MLDPMKNKKLNKDVEEKFELNGVIYIQVTEIR